MIPAAGQGALAVTARAADDEVATLLRLLDDATSRACVEAERAFMRHVGAGCHAPAGAYARTDESGGIRLLAAVFAPDGAREVRTTVRGTLDEAESIGRRAAAHVLGHGGRDMLRQSAKEG
jgi:hydroxymethylbilane synthase